MYSAIPSKDLQYGLAAQCLHQHLNFLRYVFHDTFWVDLSVICLKSKQYSLLILTHLVLDCLRWAVWTFRFALYIYLFAINLGLFLVNEKVLVNGLHANAMYVVSMPLCLSDRNQHLY